MLDKGGVPNVPKGGMSLSNKFLHAKQRSCHQCNSYLFLRSKHGSSRDPELKLSEDDGERRSKCMIMIRE
mgnify:CR=1 FL=1